MDRKHFVLEKARELLAPIWKKRFSVVRQDRAMLRGWQEPAHIRSVLRRSINEQSVSPQENGSVARAAETEFGRTAGEPDRGQQRECLGQILEAGASAMEKMLGSPHPELSACRTAWARMRAVALCPSLLAADE